MESTSFTSDPNEQTESIFTEEIPKPNSQRKLLLIPIAFVLVGFFLPWVNYGLSEYNYLRDSIPTINGLYLVEQVGAMPVYGWLLTVFILLVPIGALLAATSCLLKEPSEKLLMIGIACFVFIPVSLITIYLVMMRYPYFMGIGLTGGLIRMGIGFILMIVGAITCFIYAMMRILSNARNMPGLPIVSFGLLGGFVTALIVFFIIDSMKDPGQMVGYLYLLMVITGLLLTGYIYRVKARESNYHSTILTGFVFSLVYTITLLILGTMKNGSFANAAGMAFIFLVVVQLLFGFLVSAIGSGEGDRNNEVKETFELTNGN